MTAWPSRTVFAESVQLRALRSDVRAVLASLGYGVRRTTSMGERGFRLVADRRVAVPDVVDAGGVDALELTVLVTTCAAVVADRVAAAGVDQSHPQRIHVTARPAWCASEEWTPLSRLGPFRPPGALDVGRYWARPEVWRVVASAEAVLAMFEAKLEDRSRSANDGSR